MDHDTFPYNGAMRYPLLRLKAVVPLILLLMFPAQELVAELRLVVKNRRLVSDGVQSTILLLAGVPAGREGALRWNVEPDLLSPLRPVLPGTWSCDFKAPSNKTGAFELVVSMEGEGRSSVTIDILKPLRLEFSNNSVAVGTTQGVGVRALGEYIGTLDLLLKTSSGTVEKSDPAWRLMPPKSGDPHKAWLTLVERTRPETALAFGALDILASRELSVKSDPGVKFFMEIDGVVSGPFSAVNGKLPISIPPGASRVVFIAEDAAGNRQEKVQEIKPPPRLDLILLADKSQVPLGGFPVFFKVMNLGNPVDISRLRLSAGQGLCSSLTPLGSNFAFTYTSPQKGAVGPDRIAVSLQGAPGAVAGHTVEVVAGVLSKTITKPVEVKKLEGGSTEVTVLLEMYDDSGNPINDAEFEIVNSSGNAMEVFDLEEGKYSFKMLLPPGANPADVVSLKAEMAPYDLDLKTSQIVTLDSEADGYVVFMALDSFGLPIGNLPLTLTGSDGGELELRTNAIGLATWDLSGRQDLEGIQVGFKGVPGSSTDILLARGALKRALDVSLNRQGVSKAKIVEVQKQTGEIRVQLAVGADGQVEAMVAKSTPDRVRFRPAQVKIEADGKNSMTIEITLSSREGLPVPGVRIDIRAGQGRVGPVTDTGGGHYTFEYTPDAVTSDTYVTFDIVVAGGVKSLTERLSLTAPPAGGTAAATAATTTTAGTTTTAAATTGTAGQTVAGTTATGTASTSSGNSGTGTATAGSSTATTNTASGTTGTSTTTTTPCVPTSVTFTKATESVQSPNTLSVSAKVVCESGSAAPDGTEVTFTASAGTVTSSAKTVSGVASALFTPQAAAGTVAITASSGSAKGSMSVDVQAETKVYTPTCSALSVTYPNTVEVSITVKDQKGQAAPDGTAVALSVDKGTVASSAQTSGGVAKVTYTPPARDDPTWSVKVGTVPKETALDKTVSLQWTPSVSAKLTDSAKLVAAVADKKCESAISIQYGQPGFDVELKASSGSFSPQSVTVTGSAFSGVYTPSNSTGDVTLKVVYRGSTLWEKDITITAGAANKPSLTLTQTSAEACSVTTVELVAEVKDAFNNFVVGERVDFSIVERQTTFGSLQTDGTLIKSFENTDSNGQARIRYSVGGKPGRTVFSASLNKLPNEKFIPESVILTETPCNPTLRLESAAAGAGSARPSGTLPAGSTLSIFPTVRDQNNNFMLHEGVSWSVENVSGGVTAASLSVAGDQKSAALSSQKVGSLRVRATHTSYGTSTLDITVTPLLASKFTLAGAAATVAGQSVSLGMTALDIFDNTATAYAGTKSLIFSGPGTISSFAATVQGSASATAVGQATAVSFNAGLATLTARLYKVESTSISATDGAVSVVTPLSIKVTPTVLGSFQSFFVQISGTLGAHLVVTARDTYTNAIANHDPASDISLSLATGTQSGDNILWHDLPAGAVDNRNGTATVLVASFSTFDASGQMLVGFSNTLAETNVVRVAEGGVSANTNAFTWTPNAARKLLYVVEPPLVAVAFTALTTFTLRIADDFGNTVNSDNGRVLSLTVLTGTGTFSGGSALTVNGVATFSAVTYPNAEVVSYNVSATGLTNAPNRTLTVTGGGIASFKLVSAVASATAGTVLSITVTALNAASTTASGYTGTVQFTSSDAQAGLPAATAFQASDLGVKTFSVTYKTAGSQTVSVQDTGLSSTKTTSSAVTVSAAAAAKLAYAVFSSSSVVNSAWTSFKLQIQDSFSNLTADTTSISLSKISGAGTLSGTLTAAAVAGVATFSNIQHDTVEAVQLRASGTGLTPADSASVAVVAAGLHHYTLSVPVSTVLVGTPLLTTLVTAVDGNGQPVSTYTGTVQFTATDGAAVLPANYTYTPFEGGEHSFTNLLTFNTVGSFTFSVVDTAQASSLTLSPTVTVVASLSKALLAARGKSGDSTPPTASNLYIVPSRFEPGDRGDTVAILVDGISDDVAVDQVMLKIVGNSRIRRLMLKGSDNGQATFMWDGRDDAGQRLDNGIYTVQVTVFDRSGLPSLPLNGAVEIESNIEFGNFGP